MVNMLADGLTLLRFLLVVVILQVGVVRGPDEGLASVATLTVLAWITDVLDGPLARRARRPTHLGRCDLVADIALTLALATCLVVWRVLPLLLVAGGLALAGLSARKLHMMAPLQLAMGLIYGTYILTAWRTAPKWGRVMTGSVAGLALLNPQRAREQIRGFLNQMGSILGHVWSAFVGADRRV
ncbi:MAG: CDP-alcohol phosphatidyltransferase family protein [Chloroflexota bacterium]|nr:CDP-alcohol phosphatidyltransferase family protein [Chloroflexota bacterium]